jgi:TonB family protein
MPAVLFAAIAAAAVLSGEPPAPDGFPLVDPPVRTRPDWIRVPTLDDIADFYPRRARARGIEGRVVLDCRVAVVGRLKDCRVHQETPEGTGFGEAALELAPLIVARPGTLDGVPIADELVRVPIAFMLPGGPLPGLEETLRCHGLLSAHLALGPDDSRLAEAAGLAGERADVLMAEQGLGEEVRQQRLTAARAAAPRPRRVGATRDPCFLAFVQ